MNISPTLGTSQIIGDVCVNWLWRIQYFYTT